MSDPLTAMTFDEMQALINQVQVGDIFVIQFGTWSITGPKQLSNLALPNELGQPVLQFEESPNLSVTRQVRVVAGPAWSPSLLRDLSASLEAVQIVGR